MSFYPLTFIPSSFFEKTNLSQYLIKFLKFKVQTDILN